MPTLHLKLFVAGDTPRARDARANLARLCREQLGGDAEVEMVDVLEHPELADEFRILTTPTVVRVSPPPRRRVTGDLGVPTLVLDALGLSPASPPPGPRNG